MNYPIVPCLSEMNEGYGYVSGLKKSTFTVEVMGMNYLILSWWVDVSE